MGLWSDLKKEAKKVKKAAKDAADAVEEVANDAGEAVSDFVETVGNGIEDGLAGIADEARKVPVVGSVLGGVCRWIGGAISGALDLVGAAVKGVLGVVGGILGGVLRIVGGILRLDPGPILQGLGDIFSGIGGAVLVILGKLVALVQVVLLIQDTERPLTAEERRLLRLVFHRSIALHNVRLVPGRAGVFGVNDRPFTLGNTVYLKGRDPRKEPELLVHECVHVWQYQNEGARYASDALAAQAVEDDAYAWEDEISRGHTKWVDFNREAQAQLFEDTYTDGGLFQVATATVVRRGDGAFFQATEYDGDRGQVGVLEVHGHDHSVLARTAVKTVRARRAFRLSGFWS
jgi:hypothetical protein